MEVLRRIRMRVSSESEDGAVEIGETLLIVETHQQAFLASFFVRSGRRFCRDMWCFGVRIIPLCTSRVVLTFTVLPC